MKMPEPTRCDLCNESLPDSLFKEADAWFVLCPKCFDLWRGGRLMPLCVGCGCRCYTLNGKSNCCERNVAWQKIDENGKVLP